MDMGGGIHFTAYSFVLYAYIIYIFNKEKSLMLKKRTKEKIKS